MFLDLILKTKCLSDIDVSIQRNLHVFQMLTARMSSKCRARKWTPKTVSQWRFKWKSLRSVYRSFEMVKGLFTGSL